MDAEHIFHQAVEISDPQQRVAYLNRTCHGDSTLRAEVEALLRADERAGSFLESPPAAVGATLEDLTRGEGPGTVIGRYELLELLGEGGMGLVYLAEQKEPVRRKVAFKIIKPGMDSRQVIARFEAERQALALLDHPNIARVFDAGCTDAGRPYFVMEHVKGLPITRYCDDNKVPIEQRLRLFEQVCEAVQHAHQKGIIHRDLKPSNILVSVHGDRAIPKIIDFGIAKAITAPLTDKTCVTFQGQLLGTPEYMSPEQVDLATQDIDTRSDIYSLGVVLYELLAGVLPFESEIFERVSLAELQQTIWETEPAAPGLRLTGLGEQAKAIAARRGTQVIPLARRLHRELEWIPLKAMRKDRCRRYKSASDLADDVRNYLNGNPLLAGPETAVYRVQKFVRKHAGSVGTAILLAVVIVLGLVVSIWQAKVATNAKERAIRSEAEKDRQAQIALEERDKAMAAQQQAEEQRRRAEAGKLLALGQTQLEGDPTAALAHTRASLELADTAEARRFALRVLWRGPVARILPVQCMAREQHLPQDSSPLTWIELSPDGHWLATPSRSNRRVLIFPWDGGPPRALPRQPSGNTWASEFGPRSDLFITGGSGSSMRFWSLPELKEVRTIELGGFYSWADVRGDKLFTCTWMDKEGTNLLLRAWPLPEGKPEVLGAFPRPKSGWAADPGGTMVAYGREGTVCVRPLDSSGSLAERVLGQGSDEDKVRNVAFGPRGDCLASLHRSGEIRIWSMAGQTAGALRVIRGPKYEFPLLLFDPEGRLLTQVGPKDGFFLWELDGPPNSEPVVLGRSVPGAVLLAAFDRQGKWLATSYGIDTVEFWPLRTPRVRMIRGITSTIWDMAFTGDSRWLATSALGQPARLWPLSATDGAARDLLSAKPSVSLGTHPTRSDMLVGTTKGEVFVCPTDGGQTRQLPGGWAGRAMATPVAFDPTGRWAVATPYNRGQGIKDPNDRVVRIWDLESERERVYSIAHLTDPNWDAAHSLGFAADGRLYGPLRKGDQTQIVRLTLPAEPEGEILGETIVTAGVARSRLSPDGRLLLVLASDIALTHNMQYEQLLLFDLVEGTSRQITTHGDRLSPATAFDFSGRVIVTADVDGIVRVGPVTGEEPHLLLGHEGMITSVAISPDGRWIASATEESIRLWPMPDVAEPPLHTLPHGELTAKLDALTNLRVVRDTASSIGWKLDIGPFPGWKDAPAWFRPVPRASAGVVAP